jgi:hypothetical protein
MKLNWHAHIVAFMLTITVALSQSLAQPRDLNMFQDEATYYSGGDMSPLSGGRGSLDDAEWFPEDDRASGLSNVSLSDDDLSAVLKGLPEDVDPLHVAMTLSLGP